MSAVGTRQKLVNAQKMTLTNVTDNQSYTQLSNLVYDITRSTKFKSLQNATMERLFGVANNSLEFDILLTVPQVATFIDLTRIISNVNRNLPVKSWRITGTSKDGTTFTITFSGSVVALRTIRPNAGAGEHHIRIESTDITVTVA